MSLNILVALMNVCVLPILLHINTAGGQGFFTMEVLLETYSNPTSEDCDACNCDAFNIFCNLESTCENIFTFCLRRADVSSLCSFGSFTSAIYENDEFSFSSNVVRQLRISNPLTFSSIPAGVPVVLEIDIYDHDGDQLIPNPNDYVDTISLSLPGITTTTLDYTQSMVLTGRCGRSTIQLQYRISCAQGYEGPRCNCTSQPGQSICNPNGNRTCIFPFTGLQCTQCVTGYYGSRCERYCVPEPEIYTCDVNGYRRCVIQFAALPECVECIEGYYGPRCDCMPQPGQYTCTSNGTRICIFPFTGPLCGTCVSGYYGQTCNCTDLPGRYTCNSDGTVNCMGNFTMESLCRTCLMDHYKDDCSVYCSTLNFPGYECDNEGMLVYTCQSPIDPRCSTSTIIYIVIACVTVLPGVLCLCFVVVAVVRKRRNKDTKYS